MRNDLVDSECLSQKSSACRLAPVTLFSPRKLQTGTKRVEGVVCRIGMGLRRGVKSMSCRSSAVNIERSAVLSYSLSLALFGYKNHFVIVQQYASVRIHFDSPSKKERFASMRLFERLAKYNPTPCTISTPTQTRASTQAPPTDHSPSIPSECA